ncbi:MAG: hypothetical protein R3C05_15945 [Pirellulaceae bacterium]
MVLPDVAAEGKPWVWRARFPGYHDEIDAKLVADGFHLGYVDVAGCLETKKQWISETLSIST